MVLTSRGRASMDYVHPPARVLRGSLQTVSQAPPGPRTATPAPAALLARASAPPTPAGPPPAHRVLPGRMTATPVCVETQPLLSAPRKSAKIPVGWCQAQLWGHPVSFPFPGEARPTMGAHHGPMEDQNKGRVGAQPEPMKRTCMLMVRGTMVSVGQTVQW